MAADDYLGEIRQFPSLLRHKIAARLRSAIGAGRLKPGDRLVESQLSKSMGISRPSLREAVRQIEAEGLVEVIPNVGPVVRNPSIEERKETSDVAAAINALCARYFAERGQLEDFDQLDKAIDGIEAALNARDSDRVREAQEQYHEVLAQGAKSETIAKYVLQLAALTGNQRGISLHVDGRPAEAVFEFRRIAEAIRNRNAEEAVAASVLQSRHAKMTLIRRHEAMLAEEARLRQGTAND